MEAQIDNAIKTVREICSRLRPPGLDHFGLPAAVQWYAQEFSKRTGVACNCEIDPDVSLRDKEFGLMLFRILQEAMTNVIRHALARNVKVLLKKEGSVLILKVEDDGKGIYEGEISDPRSLGIIGTGFFQR
jgi:two-component system, NarL family, sensor histidine kinase UhpB